MPAPSVLTHKELLQALGAEFRSSSDLAAELKVSRATIHRKITPLVADGLVAQTGKGPSTGYRLKTPQEQLEGPGQPGSAQRKVHVSMDEKTANVVQAALEFYSRIGIGQFEELLSLARYGQLKRFDGADIDLDRLDQAEGLVRQLKAVLLDMPANASFGIHSEHVNIAAKASWAVSRAIRHRMAWDRSPEGGMGVSFDEPLRGEFQTDITVSSGTASTPVDLSDLPPGMLLQHRGDQYRILGPTEDGEHLRVYGESHSVQTAIQMARNVVQGKPDRRFSML